MDERKVNTTTFVNHDPTVPLLPPNVIRVVTDIRDTEDGFEVEYGFITFPAQSNQVELIEDELDIKGIE